MSATTNSEFNFKKIIAWGVLIAIGCVVFVLAMISIARMAKGDKQIDPEAVNQRIAPVATVMLAAPMAAGGGAARSGEQIYKASCAACHDSGVANAPKLGDKGAWAPRLALGLDGLLKSAIAGKNAMPPKGGSDASDTELASTIVYLANKSGGNFKEPAAK
ncbi:MAG: c-type cytochrome [Burkholderiaceae bacterium]|nr:c-type cytochrome [Sulfuritalea sp.]MCF8174970.1 c-type cytochrome [Burkholderiaceae bacterium]MCF8183804.1 c-type cytochrome [Polynucleobacter sp.]